MLRYKIEILPVFESEDNQYYRVMIFQRSDEDAETFEIMDILHFEKLSHVIFLSKQNNMEADRN